METEMRGPGSIDHERDLMVVGRLRQAGDVPDGADVRRVADEHGTSVRVFVEGNADGVGRHAERETGRRVDLGSDPDGPQPGQHQPEQHRSVQGAADNDLVAVPGDGEGNGLVGLRRPARGEAAEVGAPQLCGSTLGLGQHAGAQLHRVEPGVERDVAGDNVAHQIRALLVAGDRERGGACS